MSTMEAVGTVRRQAGAAHRQPMGSAASGATRRKAQRTSGRLSTAQTTECRAVMVKHTVQILSNYADLRGYYGTVVRGDVGDRTVLVAVSAPGGQRREICYATREVRHVAMDDAIMHDADEECRLIRRSVQLACPEDYMPRTQTVTAELAEAVKARLSRLRAQIRAIQRAKSTRPGNRFCTALVAGKGVGA